MSHRRDARELAERLASEGFAVGLTKGGHWEVREKPSATCRKGRRVVTFGKTPSDSHWKRNALSDIRKWRLRQVA